nr:thioester reductase domain-containing protein [Phytohabitans suffuscus]
MALLGCAAGAVMGHSVGEYVAACVAGVLSAEDALTLVAARARLMQSVTAPGAMVAVKLTEEEAEAARREVGDAVSVASVNSDQDVVLSGAAEAIAELVARLEERKVSVRRLRVSHAFHSSLVEPALGELREVAASVRFAAPRVPLVSNLTGKVAEAGMLSDPEYWCRHAREAVRFRDGMRAMDELGFSTFLEVGPGRTLLGLGAACLPGDERAWAASLRRSVPASEQVRIALGELHVLGVPVDLAAVHPGGTPSAVLPLLPTYAFDRGRYWFTTRVRDVDTAPAPDRPDEPTLLPSMRAAAPEERLGLLADYLRDLLAAALWTPAGEIDTDADLLPMGVDSLLVMQVVTAVKSALDVTFSPRELFEAATIEEWSRLIVERAEEAHSLPGAGRRSGTRAARRDWSDPAELVRESVLDPAIVPDGPLGDGWRDPREVLLTGATGFVGAFLLEELLRTTKARVHCLVRAEDAATGLARLRAATERYLPWPSEHEDRITVVPGDLSRPLLGLDTAAFDALAARLDAIYHNGANVNFVHTFPQLRAANVGGTQEILRLACRGPLTPVNHVSTFAIWGVPEDLTSTFAEDDDLTTAGRLPNGYLQSKWTGEQLVLAARRRGVPVNVYRLGQIMGDSRRGACVTNSFTCAVIKGCIQFGSAPELDMLVEMTPADYVSRAMVHISTTSAWGRNFHLLNPERLHFSELVGYIRRRGWPVEVLSGPEWVASFREQLGGGRENALNPLIDTISEIVHVGQDSMTYRVDNLLAGLAGSGISCPPLDESLLDTYFGWMEATGFLDRPAVPHTTSGARP